MLTNVENFGGLLTLPIVNPLEEQQEITRELATRVEGSHAYKALLRDKAEVEVQLIGAGVIA